MVFRSPEGDLLEILDARLVLEDDRGTALARQEFGPSAGVLLFRANWSGVAVGRQISLDANSRLPNGVLVPWKATVPLGTRIQ